MGTPATPLSDWVEPVLVLAPTGGDAALAVELMAEVGAHAVVCQSMADIVAGIERGAAALVLASEALEDGSADVLSQALARQPAWSDIPVILLTLEGSEAPSLVEELMGHVGNISLLERPFRAATLLSVLKVVLRGRRRQFEVRRLLDSERKARARAASESRRADNRERELRASEERFRLIANSIPQLAWMATPNGRLFWFNERWYQVSGAQTDDPRSGWRAWIEAQDSDHLAMAEPRWRRSLVTGIPFDMELPIRRHDGEVRWFLTRAVPAPGDAGIPCASADAGGMGEERTFGGTVTAARAIEGNRAGFPDPRHAAAALRRAGKRGRAGPVRSQGCQGTDFL